MEKLFSTLQTSPRGLTSAGAATLLGLFGGNELETKKQKKILAFLPLAVEAVAVEAMTVGLSRGGGHGAVGSALIALLAADFVVCIAERNSAGESAAAALVTRLAPSRRAFWVLRDGVWSGQDAAGLVLGDIMHIRSGDVVPVDARLLEKTTESAPVTINIDQSALTGDPLLAAKGPGDAVYAGSACAKGEAQAVVFAGGAHTYLADAVRLADSNLHTSSRVLGASRAVWNACIVWVCFAVLVDAVTRNLGRYDGDGVAALLPIGIMFLVAMGVVLSDYLDEPWEDRRRRLANSGRDTEGLMRRLRALREQGKISEETVQRCRGLFGVEQPLCDELGAALANYFGWVMPARPHRHEDQGDGQTA